MTVTEFNNLFDIYYDNIAGQSNPDIDIFEKSNYLTTAQLEIIKNYYSSLSNVKKSGFENSEKRRRDLNTLVKNYKTSLQIESSEGINENSKFFKIPDDTMFIVFEKLIIKSSDCFNNKSINVKPVTHDNYIVDIKNPFKNPNENLAWRLDLNDIDNNKVVEIITTFSTFEYNMRYIKYPNPIILKDLNLIYPNDDLSIDGKTEEATSELNESIHREILDRAVELALSDYKPSKLQNKVQLDVRNE